MSEVTGILSAIEQGDAHAAEQLLHLGLRLYHIAALAIQHEQPSSRSYGSSE